MMYPVTNVQYYKLYDREANEIIDYFYSDEELIKFLAKWYVSSSYMDDALDWYPKWSNRFIHLCTCDVNELDATNCSWNYRRYILFDNLDRIINVQNFAQAAFELFKSWDESTRLHNQTDLMWWRHRRGRSKYAVWRKFRDNYIYRQTPVPHTAKRWRGGSYSRGPRTAHIIRMYANPDYKYFNRGEKNLVPIYWDDKDRCVQRTWKEQSKARHQWQRGHY